MSIVFRPLLSSLENSFLSQILMLLTESLDAICNLNSVARLCSISHLLSSRTISFNEDASHRRGVIAKVFFFSANLNKYGGQCGEETHTNKHNNKKSV